MIQLSHVISCLLFIALVLVSASHFFLSQDLNRLKSRANLTGVLSVRSESIIPPPSPQLSTFDHLVKTSYAEATSIDKSRIARGSFNLTAWKRGSGGLTDNDRTVIAKYYAKASALFEYGLGESTLIASRIGVPRYAGIDSDAKWIVGVRNKVQRHFRFYLADIGPTGQWGVPTERTLPKAPYNYEIMPLQAELEAFDVYVIDGRYRLASLWAAVLHSSHRQGNPQNTFFILHDCPSPDSPTNIWRGNDLQNRQKYREADDLLKLVEHSGHKLCVFQRASITTDEQVYEKWMMSRFDIDRR